MNELPKPFRILRGNDWAVNHFGVSEIESGDTYGDRFSDDSGGAGVDAGARAAYSCSTSDGNKGGPASGSASISASNAASSSTGILSDRAFSNFDPASSPATT